MLVSSTMPSYAIGPAGLAARHDKQVTRIKASQPTLAPLGFVNYCVKNSDDCRPSQGPDVVPLTYAKLRELRQVNFQINRAIAPMNDSEGTDEWRADAASGDCEDYALAKRRALIRKGWPANSIRLAVTYTPDNIGHAVLVVRTTGGDMVLDNRTNSVLEWQQTDLRWVMIQSGSNPLYWNHVSA
jgi:Predicted periplasmic protein